MKAAVWYPCFLRSSAQVTVLRRERNSEVSDAVHARQETSQDAGVRGIGDGAVGESLREADAVRGERVKCRRLDLFVAIAANMVSAESIDGDEEHVWLRDWTCWRRLCPHRRCGCRVNKKKKGQERAERFHQGSAYHNVCGMFQSTAETQGPQEKGCLCLSLGHSLTPCLGGVLAGALEPASLR